MYYIACQRSTKSTARGLPEVYIACERSEHFRVCEEYFELNIRVYIF